MKTNGTWNVWKRLVLAAAVAGGVAGVAHAQSQSGDGPAWGPGMMGGAGPGYGMMYGGGPGGYGYGHGMMGGAGMGPGMMGGAGGCPMMEGMGPLWQLNLTADQKKKIDGLMSQERDLHWSVMKTLSDDYSKLHTLYSADTLDQGAIDKVYDDIFKNQRAMIDSQIRMRNQIYNMLTPEQKSQLKQSGGRGYGPGPGPAR